MALCRCKKHPAPLSYTHSVDPIGYPDTSSICGRKNSKEYCEEPGLIWLKANEVLAFNNIQNPQRIFTYDHDCSKVKVSNNLNKK